MKHAAICSKQARLISGAMNRPLSLLALLLVIPAAHASSEPPQRTRMAVTYGDDRCPEQTDPDEIVVCGHEPESERYRIPKKLRERPDDAPMAQAWGARVEDMDQITRFTRPNSCSAVGSGGQTGCTAVAMQQWFAARRAMKAEAEAWKDKGE